MESIIERLDNITNRLERLEQYKSNNVGTGDRVTEGRSFGRRIGNSVIFSRGSSNQYTGPSYGNADRGHLNTRLSKDLGHYAPANKSSNPDFGKLVNNVSDCIRIRHQLVSWVSVPISIDNKFDGIFDNIHLPLHNDSLYDKLSKLKNDTKTNLLLTIQEYLVDKLDVLRESRNQMDKTDIEWACRLAKRRCIKLNKKLSSSVIDEWVNEEINKDSTNLVDMREPEGTEGRSDTLPNNPKKRRRGPLNTSVLENQNSNTIVTTNRFSGREQFVEQNAPRLNQTIGTYSEVVSGGRPKNIQFNNNTKFTLGPSNVDLLTLPTPPPRRSPSNQKVQSAENNTRINEQSLTQNKTSTVADKNKNAGNTTVLDKNLETIPQVIAKQATNIDTCSAQNTISHKETGPKSVEQKSDNNAKQASNNNAKQAINNSITVQAEIHADINKISTNHTNKQNYTHASPDEDDLEPLEVQSFPLPRRMSLSQHFKNKPEVHENTWRRDWRVELRRPVTHLIIADSNFRHATNLPANCEIHVFPGLNLEQCWKLLQRSNLSTRSSLNCIIVSVGINNRACNKNNNNIDLGKLKSELNKTGKLYYFNLVSIPDTLSTQESENLIKLNHDAQRKFDHNAIASVSPVGIMPMDKYKIHYDIETIDKICTNIRNTIFRVVTTNSNNQ